MTTNQISASVLHFNSWIKWIFVGIARMAVLLVVAAAVGGFWLNTYIDLTSERMKNEQLTVQLEKTRQELNDLKIEYARLDAAHKAALIPQATIGAAINEGIIQPVGGLLKGGYNTVKGLFVEEKKDPVAEAAKLFNSLDMKSAKEILANISGK